MHLIDYIDTRPLDSVYPTVNSRALSPIQALSRIRTKLQDVYSCLESLIIDNETMEYARNIIHNTAQPYVDSFEQNHMRANGYNTRSENNKTTVTTNKDTITTNNESILSHNANIDSILSSNEDDYDYIIDKIASLTSSVVAVYPQLQYELDNNITPKSLMFPPCSTGRYNSNDDLFNVATYYGILIINTNGFRDDRQFYGDVVNYGIDSQITNDGILLNFGTHINTTSFGRITINAYPTTSSNDIGISYYGYHTHNGDNTGLTLVNGYSVGAVYSAYNSHANAHNAYNSRSRAKYSYNSYNTDNDNSPHYFSSAYRTEYTNMIDCHDIDFGDNCIVIYNNDGSIDVTNNNTSRTQFFFQSDLPYNPPSNVDATNTLVTQNKFKMYNIKYVSEDGGWMVVCPVGETTHLYPFMCYDTTYYNNLLGHEYTNPNNPKKIYPLNFFNKDVYGLSHNEYTFTDDVLIKTNSKLLTSMDFELETIDGVQCFTYTNDNLYGAISSHFFNFDALTNMSYINYGIVIKKINNINKLIIRHKDKTTIQAFRDWYELANVKTVVYIPELNSDGTIGFNDYYYFPSQSYECYNSRQPNAVHAENSYISKSARVAFCSKCKDITNTNIYSIEEA